MSEELHYLPRNEAFDRMLELNAESTDLGRVTGSLPAYPVFVDNLFKQLPLLDGRDVARLILEQAGIRGDGTVHAEALLVLLREMETADGSAMHAAIGCAGEGGELLDCVKKVFIYRKEWGQRDAKTGQTPLENLLEELADFRFYYQKLLNMLRISDQDVQAMSYVKLRERYATGRYSDAQAQARADKAEEKMKERRYFGQPDAPGVDLPNDKKA